MGYFRIQYDGYLEDEFDNKDAAIDAFLNMLEDADEVNITVEEWDEKEQEWETV